MKKKLLIFIVVVAMVLSLAILVACEPKPNDENQDTPPADGGISSGEIDSGEEESPKDEDIFVTDGYGAIKALTKLGKTLTSITVPSKIGDEDIKSIGDSVFINLSYLTSVKISSGIESIGKYVFENSKKLVEVEIPDTVTQIGERAFYACASLQKITLPKSLDTLQELTFASCESLKTVELPQDLETIESSVFSGCEALENISLPNSLTYISDYVFQESALKSIEIPSDVTYVGDYAFQNCKSLESANILANIDTIGNSMFMGCEKLSDVSIPSSVSKIDYYAFCDCSALAEIEIPTSVTLIGRGAFYGCSALAEIEIPSSVISIGESAFRSCENLTKVTFDSDTELTSIANYAFENCSMLQEIEIPMTVKDMGESVFDSCKKLAIYIQNTSAPQGWQSSWNYSRPAVFGTKAHGITAGGVKWGMTDDEVIVITGIKDDVQEVEIPDTIEGKSVQSICRYAFADLDILTDLIVPSSITSVDAFIYNSTDKNLVIYSKSQVAQEWTGNNNNTVMWNYKSHGVTDNIRWGLTQADEIYIVGYNGVATDLSIPSTINGNAVKAISNRAFGYCAQLQSVTLPSGLTSIGELAFSNCDKLTKAELPNTLEVIGGGAFSNCTSLNEIELGDSLTTISKSAFSSCSNLVSVTISQSVSTIGAEAFGYCSKVVIYCEVASRPSGWDTNWYKNITAVIWDCKNNDATSMGKIYYTDTNSVRYELNGSYATVDLLTKPISGKLEIPQSVTYKDKTYQVNAIGDNAFSNGGELTSIELPSSITQIGKSAFTGCENLQYNEYDNALYLGNSANPYMILVKAKDNNIASCVINTNAKMIAYEAFKYCRSLTEIEIPSSVDIIGGYAFHGCTTLTNIKISNGVERIEDSAFYDCVKLSNIIIPVSVNYVSSRVFMNCRDLNINCEAVSQPSSWSNDWNSGCSVTWGYGNVTTNEDFDYVAHDGNVYLTSYKGSSTQVVVPETIDGKKVVDIGTIFRGSNITSIELPSGVSVIYDRAFYQCSNLTSVTMSQQSVVSIGEFAFASCSRLNSIELPLTLKSIGYMAFDTCGALRSIYIPESVEFIGERAFYYCNNLTVNAQADSKPAMWNDDWNLVYSSASTPTYTNVVWGYVKE